MPDAISAVESAFGELAAGLAVLPQRIAIRDPAPGLSLYMPAFLSQSGALTCKVVSVYPTNPAQFDLPTTMGKILVQDPASGKVVCIMDGGFVTAVRTGAVTGVSIKYLARKDSKVLGLYGAGVQAEQQLVAACATASIEKCQLFDPRTEVAENFQEKFARELGIDIQLMSSAEEVWPGADILVAASTSTTPLFDGSAIPDGTHISGIGAHSPGARELDLATIQRAKIVCDLTSACLAEAGEFIIPMQEGAFSADQIYGDLGELVNGTKAGRESDAEITLFKSVGLAIQDAAVAKLVFDKATTLSIGTDVDF
jgi:ornithine cyclodeaminase/alanine dehydrogenase